jgi:hypothetical protein
VRILQEVSDPLFPIDSEEVAGHLCLFSKDHVMDTDFAQQKLVHLGTPLV